MFYAVSFFRTFGIVKTIGSTYQITGDPADPFKFNAFSYFLIFYCHC